MPKLSLKRARLWTIVWGMVLLGIAIAARHSKSVLETGLTIGSIPMGALLGVFLLGVLTKKPREIASLDRGNKFVNGEVIVIDGGFTATT